MMRRWDWAALTLLLGVVLFFVFVVNRPSRIDGTVAFDVYQYYYPNMLYAVEALRHGGQGLWWNALLNCGQPFFGNNFTGLLYPATIFWLLFEPDSALKTAIGFNLLVAGVSAYALGRALGCGVVAALCGALAFQLGNATVGFSMWGPQVSGAYVWLPAALLGCERLLQHPGFARALFLSTVLAIALLPGFPQVVLFTYQLIALRVVWELTTRRVLHPLRTVAWMGLALILPPLLVAVQFLPGLEVANLSVRNAPLSVPEMAAEGFLKWEVYRDAVASRRIAVNPLILVPCIVGGAALLKKTTRRLSLFYLAAGVIYFVLAFGHDGPLFEWYTALPLGKLFRDPKRFMWVPAFCLAVLTALGAEALLSRDESSRRVRVGTAVIAAAVVLGYCALIPGGFVANEWAIAAVTVVAMTLTVSLPVPARPWAAMLILGALLVNLFLLHRTTMVRLLPDGKRLYAHRHLFEALKQRMTAQDRVHLITGAKDFSLEPKTASLFGIPSTYDYEPAPTRRYAAFFVMLRTGREMSLLNDFYFPATGYNPVGFKRRLMDLAAGRFVVASTAVDQTAKVIQPSLELVLGRPRLRVYENPRALPRAFYVPRVEVVANASILLTRLATGDDDLRRLALIEEPPASGFLGLPDHNDGGSATFVRNDPEHLTIRVQAPARGFLFLADQYFPGWGATVNGATVPILRANYLFRLVEVPPGESLVEFRYRPGSVRLGAAVSALTWIGIASAWILFSLRRRG